MPNDDWLVHMPASLHGISECWSPFVLDRRCANPTISSPTTDVAKEVLGPETPFQKRTRNSIKTFVVFFGFSSK